MLESLKYYRTGTHPSYWLRAGTVGENNGVGVPPAAAAIHINGASRIPPNRSFQRLRESINSSDQRDALSLVRNLAGKPKAHSVFEERNRTIKTALKGFRNALSEAVDYTMRIDEWNCDYSFGLDSFYDPLHRDDGLSFLHESPFYEYRDLVLRGVFLAPAKLRQRKCEARFVRRAYLDMKTIEHDLHHYEESPPKCIGGFSKQSDSILAILAIPEDAFPLAHQNVAAHKIKFMTLRGEKLRYGRNDIYGYSLQDEQDE